MGNPALEGFGFGLAGTENEGVEAGFVDAVCILDSSMGVG